MPGVEFMRFAHEAMLLWRKLPCAKFGRLSIANVGAGRRRTAALMRRQKPMASFRQEGEEWLLRLIDRA
jgi:hypothetical protein